MYRFITIMLAVLYISCNTNQKPTVTTLAHKETNTFEFQTVIKDLKKEEFATEPYVLNFKIEKLEQENYELVIEMNLKNGSYYVSPNAKRDFKGKFSLVFDENDKLKLSSKLKETPLSVEEYDPHPFVNGTVNWVRENTSYHQKLKPNTNEDFNVKGHIQFTIEPRCTLEKIPFIIKYHNGEMKIELFGC